MKIFVHSANFKEDMCDDSPFTQKEIFVMTDLDREVVMRACKSSCVGLRLLWRPLGFSSNKCVCYLNAYKLFLNFHQIFILTISFIVLNVSIDFVLIYRPHPVNRIVKAWILYTSYNVGYSFVPKPLP